MLKDHSVTTGVSVCHNIIFGGFVVVLLCVRYSCHSVPVGRHVWS